MPEAQGSAPSPQPEELTAHEEKPFHRWPILDVGIILRKWRARGASGPQERADGDGGAPDAPAGSGQPPCQPCRPRPSTGAAPAPTSPASGGAGREATGFLPSKAGAAARGNRAQGCRSLLSEGHGPGPRLCLPGANQEASQPVSDARYVSSGLHSSTNGLLLWVFVLLRHASASDDQEGGT